VGDFSWGGGVDLFPVTLIDSEYRF
jgi:hypothetical protein